MTSAAGRQPEPSTTATSCAVDTGAVRRWRRRPRRRDVLMRRQPMARSGENPPASDVEQLVPTPSPAADARHGQRDHPHRAACRARSVATTCACRCGRTASRSGVAAPTGPAGSTISVPGTVSASSAFAARATVSSSVPLPLTKVTDVGRRGGRVQPVRHGDGEAEGVAVERRWRSPAVVTFCARQRRLPADRPRDAAQPPSEPASTTAAPATTRPVDAPRRTAGAGARCRAAGAGAARQRPGIGGERRGVPGGGGGHPRGARWRSGAGAGGGGAGRVIAAASIVGASGEPG